MDLDEMITEIAERIDQVTTIGVHITRRNGQVEACFNCGSETCGGFSVCVMKCSTSGKFCSLTRIMPGVVSLMQKKTL